MIRYVDNNIEMTCVIKIVTRQKITFKLKSNKSVQSK